MIVVHPYEYPTSPHQRRHGPAGYRTYQRYRPWLEDEFSFRCVYCLKRFVWHPTDIWTVDHLIPVTERPDLECNYINLVFACLFCNLRKSAARVPDPCRIAYGSCLRAEGDGSITALNGPGRRLVKILGLNHPHQIQERKKMMDVLFILARADPTQYRRLMGFPERLPDLENETDAPENNLPKGLSQSHFAKRQRNELPEIYR